MQIILKGCTQDVIDDISEQIGSLIILDCEQRGIYENDDPIFDIELNGSICSLYTYPAMICITRIDRDNFRSMAIADLRYEDVIIK